LKKNEYCFEVSALNCFLVENFLTDMRTVISNRCMVGQVWFWWKHFQ